MKEGWKTSTLEELCLFFGDGNWIESKDQSKEGYRLIQTGNIGIGEYKNKSGKEKYINEETFKRLRCTEIFGGDILVSRLPEPVGRTCIIPDLNCKMITAVDCSIIRPNEEKILSNYIKYFTQSKLYFESIKEKITGTTRDRISRKNLGKIFISYPSLSEQQRIVEILDTAFAKIDTVKQNAERNLQNAKELFQSVLNSELSLKACWSEKKISDITEVKDGTHDSPKYIEKGIPFVTQKNIKSTGLNFDDTKFITAIDHEKFYKRSDVSFGDILVSMIGANRGMAAIVDDKRTFSIKNVGLIKNSQNINQHFLLYYLKSPIAMKFVLDNSNGGAQEFIGLTSLRKFPIPYPNLSEQQQIVSKLDALSAKCKELENNYLQTINDCNELKKAILAKAFNGEL